jgi:hypothetical protein
MILLVIYIAVVTFGGISLQFQNCFSIPTLATFAEIMLLTLIAVGVVMYFVWLIPNRSRKVIEAECFNPTTDRVSPENKV